MGIKIPRWAVNLFIVWNATAVLLTNSESFALPRPFGKIIEPYARWTRILQRWSLFCPEPRRFVQSYYFEITFSDGSKIKWQRPYPQSWSYFDGNHAANWQKIDTASGHMENELFWPDMAEWIQRNVKSDAQTPSPVVVKLIHRMAPIVPPANDLAVSGDRELIFTERAVFSYDVAAHELVR